MTVAQTNNPTELTIDLQNTGQPFRGWGTSLAWWAKGVGTWPEDRVDQIVRLVTDPTDGLGLNVFRYNIGGGDQPGHNHMRRWGDVPGFKPTADGPYDWEADAAQRRVMLKLVRASKDRAIVEAFSNSPPWWMTVSGCVAGAEDGKANLKPEFENAFADYLADVAAFYRDKHAIVFDTLEPFNEPDVDWWKAGKNQEGLHIPRDQQARLIKRSRAALDQRGLRSTIISATDANSIDDALKSLLSFDAPTLAALGQVNAHSYKGTQRTELRVAAAERGKPLWQSESGPLYVGGTDYEQIMKMARRIVVDINEMQPEVWCTWQVVSGSPWGCLVDDPDNQTFRIGKKFYMLSAFTRTIRPGDRFVKVHSNIAIASVSAARNEATIVVVNLYGTPEKVRLNVKGAVLPKSATTVRTSPEEDLVALPQTNFTDGFLEITAAPESVTRLTFPVQLP